MERPELERPNLEWSKLERPDVEWRNLEWSKLERQFD
jgi:hypothetical protein